MCSYAVSAKHQFAIILYFCRNFNKEFRSLRLYKNFFLILSMKYTEKGLWNETEIPCIYF